MSSQVIEIRAGRLDQLRSGKVSSGLVRSVR